MGCAPTTQDSNGLEWKKAATEHVLMISKDLAGQGIQAVTALAGQGAALATERLAISKKVKVLLKW